MELRILGPVELVVKGRSVVLPRRQPWLILGILAIEANRFVSPERLINLVWSDSPPMRARSILQTRISEIRATLNQHLSASHILSTRDGGYRLNIAPDKVDLHRFRSLIRAARQATSDEDVRRLLREAGELWRGPVLGGWLPTASHGSFCAGFERARLTADEDLWEVELRLGHHHLIVDEMVQAAAHNPGRERLIGLAMIALHRSGRTAEALQHFDHSRRWLAAEVGVDPGVELRNLHLAILGRRDSPLRAPGSTW